MIYELGPISIEINIASSIPSLLDKIKKLNNLLGEQNQGGDMANAMPNIGNAPNNGVIDGFYTFTTMTAIDYMRGFVYRHFAENMPYFWRKLIANDEGFIIAEGAILTVHYYRIGNMPLSIRYSFLGYQIIKQLFLLINGLNQEQQWLFNKMKCELNNQLDEMMNGNALIKLEKFIKLAAAQHNDDFLREVQKALENSSFGKASVLLSVIKTLADSGWNVEKQKQFFDNVLAIKATNDDLKLEDETVFNNIIKIFNWLAKVDSSTQLGENYKSFFAGVKANSLEWAGKLVDWLGDSRMEKEEQKNFFDALIVIDNYLQLSIDNNLLTNLRAVFKQVNYDQNTAGLLADYIVVKQRNGQEYSLQKFSFKYGNFAENKQKLIKEIINSLAPLNQKLVEFLSCYVPFELNTGNEIVFRDFLNKKAEYDVPAFGISELNLQKALTGQYPELLTDIRTFFMSEGKNKPDGHAFDYLEEIYRQCNAFAKTHADDIYLIFKGVQPRPDMKLPENSSQLKEVVTNKIALLANTAHLVKLGNYTDPLKAKDIKKATLVHYKMVSFAKQQEWAYKLGASLLEKRADFSSRYSDFKLEDIQQLLLIDRVKALVLTDVHQQIAKLEEIHFALTNNYVSLGFQYFFLNETLKDYKFNYDLMSKTQKCAIGWCVFLPQPDKELARLHDNLLVPHPYNANDTDLFLASVRATSFYFTFYENQNVPGLQQVFLRMASRNADKKAELKDEGRDDLAVVDHNHDQYFKILQRQEEFVTIHVAQDHCQIFAQVNSFVIKALTLCISGYCEQDVVKNYISPLFGTAWQMRTKTNECAYWVKQLKGEGAEYNLANKGYFYNSLDLAKLVATAYSLYGNEVNDMHNSLHKLIKQLNEFAAHAEDRSNEKALILLQLANLKKAINEDYQNECEQLAGYMNESCNPCIISYGYPDDAQYTYLKLCEA